MTKVDISKLNNEELRDLRTEISKQLPKIKDPKDIATKLKRNLLFKDGLQTADEIPVFVSNHHVRESIVNPIFCLCDWTLGNYKCNTTNKRYTIGKIVRDQNVAIDDKELYYSMVEELTDLIIKYNKLAFENEGGIKCWRWDS